MKTPLPPSVHLTDFRDLSRYKKKWEELSIAEQRLEEWQISINTQYERDLFDLRKVIYED
jgi:lipocalin